MDSHKLAAVIGIVVLALGVLVLLPFVSDKVGTGKATSAEGPAGTETPRPNPYLTDTDGDGLLDYYDAMPSDSTCLIDLDDDGICDVSVAGATGTADSDIDLDYNNNLVLSLGELEAAGLVEEGSDGTLTNDDLTLAYFTPDTTDTTKIVVVDTDTDGTPDYLTDTDGDGMPNSLDDFPSDPAGVKDTDGDGKPDVVVDGYTSVYDVDTDHDGAISATELAVLDSMSSLLAGLDAADTTSDSALSPSELAVAHFTTLTEDTDDDSDGMPDLTDSAPLDPLVWESPSVPPLLPLCDLDDSDTYRPYVDGECLCPPGQSPTADGSSMICMAPYSGDADTSEPVVFTPYSGNCEAAGGTVSGSDCLCSGILIDRRSTGAQDWCMVARPTRPSTTESLPPRSLSIFGTFFNSDAEVAVAQRVTTASGAGLIVENQASWSFNWDNSLVRTTPLTGITYFNFQGKTYVIDILEFSVEDGEAKLGIREIGKEDYLRAKKVGGSGTSDKVTLKIDEDAVEAMLPRVLLEKPLIPQTVSLDLGGSNEPEFYVHFAGKLGSLDVLVTMSPLVDLSLYPSGSMIMHSETPLQFRYTDGTYHTITYIDTGSDYVIAVDGVSHVGRTGDLIGDHLGSPLASVGVLIHVVLTRDDYAVVTLEPITTDLSASYTGVFDKLTRALTLSTTTYKICADDPLDLEFVRVCNNNEGFEFGITVNTPHEVGGTLFYYTYPESRKPKEVKAYRLLDLSDPDVEILEAGFTFSSNLVMEKGLAFKVMDTLYGEDTYDYYLLTLPEDAETMNFEELIVTPLSDLNLQPPLPQSDKQRAIFNLPVERRTEEEANRVRQFNVIRVIDGTNVNYALSAVTLNKVVNLKRALQTSVDTFGGADVWLEDEEIGLIGVASTAQDTSPEFAELYIEDPNERTLVYENRPTVFDEYPDLLFVYSEHRANRDNYHSKKIDVHLLYQLGEQVETASATNQHKYTDEDFNLPMMKGYKMALEVAGNHYLLGYNPSKPWTGTEFFDAKELRLTRVGATETITKEYDASTGTMKFTLGNNYVVNVHFNLENLAEKWVEFDYDVPQGTFLAFTPELEFEAELPDRSATVLYNWLKVGEDDIYRNCDTLDYLSFTTKMLLCDDHRDSDGNDGEIVKVMEPFVRLYGSGKNILVTFREAYAGRKVVTFQYIWEELNLPGGRNSEELRWSAFNTLLSQDKNPVVVVDGDYFEITGGQSFADLGLRNLTSSEEYPVIHYVQNEGEDQGMVLVGETVFTFEQNDNLGNVEIKIGRAEYLFVDAEGFNLGEETTQGFITKVDEKVKENIYTLILTPITRSGGIVGEQVQVQQASGHPTRPAGSLLFSGNVPLMVTKEILLPNGDKIKVKPYTRIVDGVPQVQVKVSR